MLGGREVEHFEKSSKYLVEAIGERHRPSFFPHLEGSTRIEFMVVIGAMPSC